ncbi:MocR-like pyridoxine biosynthesis transcription factor PdxR [Selenihalanaerobacter shriftii]|uniref:Transcriptional regulator, GntR family n=1 Tax=Selenihalanaerobacter shriftii TaxID=142842 RepID=A0A1T4L9H4_9FIRM|nr:PLP-dependent aminotransferase family protein [Selenihalanaerobacter shriftii]SJZ51389.1 transcriptional regulator, GntR family [Selenihalanaerobacter shriftii]
MFKGVQLDKISSKHLYIQLYSQLKSLIEKGEVKTHTKLPSIRKFAEELGVNNVTVVNAYNLLAEEEIVYKKVGSGTFVAPKVEFKEDIYLDEEVYIDEDTKFIEERKESGQEGIINFATAAPTPDLFPISPFKRLINKVLERDGGYAFGYQKSQGYLALRKSISKYINRYQIEADVNEIQIISGAQQGIDILAKTFLDYGDTVFVEQPTYPGAISVFKSRNANITEIPINQNGIDLKLLESELKKEKPKFIYLMPNFQNPTGYSYSQEKKERILELAQKYDLLIIEDDCLSDLNYGESNNMALKAMDEDERVIYIKSFSKIFMPGLRLAFLIIPECHFNDILLSKYMSDIFTDGLIQRVLDLYFREELWEKQLNKLKETYQQRYQIMITVLNEYLPQECDFVAPEGGLNIWLELPQGLTANELYDKAFAAGINIAPGTVFYHNQPQTNKVRLSIAAVTEREIKEGIKKLGDVINKELSNSNQDWDNRWMPLV